MLLRMKWMNLKDCLLYFQILSKSFIKNNGASLLRAKSGSSKMKFGKAVMISFKQSRMLTMTKSYQSRRLVKLPFSSKNLKKWCWMDFMNSLNFWLSPSINQPNKKNKKNISLRWCLYSLGKWIFKNKIRVYQRILLNLLTKSLNTLRSKFDTSYFTLFTPQNPSKSFNYSIDQKISNHFGEEWLLRDCYVPFCLSVEFNKSCKV